MTNCQVLSQTQELNNKLGCSAQENKDLFNRVSSLEESISSTDSERKELKEKLGAITEEKSANENLVASLKDALQTLETEKQVRFQKTWNTCFVLRTSSPFPGVARSHARAAREKGRCSFADSLAGRFARHNLRACSHAIVVTSRARYKGPLPFPGKVWTRDFHSNSCER